jgi:hypothetical protein
MKSEDKQSTEVLNNSLVLLQQSMETLKKSVEKAESIIPKSEYSFEEMETFDSLTSKFSRSSDIFLQKVLRSIWILLHEESMPLIDMLNKAEKLNIINSADELLMIRDLRNQISDAYTPEAIQELVREVLQLMFKLKKNIAICRDFFYLRKGLFGDIIP